MSTKIKIGNNEYWFMGDNLDESCAIAPLEHCDKNGELNYSKCYKTDTFAHFFPNRGIDRYGKNIVNLKDVKKLLNN